jgi:hypothetical protein
MCLVIFIMTTYFTGMLYSAKDIYNRVMNLKKRVCDGGILEKYLMGIQQEGGTVNWTKADSGEILVLYIQTKAMYSDVQKTKPFVWQMDTTFNTNR